MPRTVAALYRPLVRKRPCALPHSLRTGRPDAALQARDALAAWHLLKSPLMSASSVTALAARAWVTTKAPS